MRVIKRIDFHNSVAILFENGDIVWGDQHYPQGLGANLNLINALSKE